MTQKNLNEIECKEVIRKVFEFIDGELDTHTHDDIKHHMESCRSCFSRAEFEIELKNRVKDTAQEKAPDELQNRLSKLMDNF